MKRETPRDCERQKQGGERRKEGETELCGEGRADRGRDRGRKTKSKQGGRQARRDGYSGAQLEGHVLTEVGWGQGAETGGGPRSWRGHTERGFEGDTAGSAAGAPASPPPSCVPLAPSSCRKAAAAERCLHALTVACCSVLPPPLCRPGVHGSTFSQAKGAARA